VQSSENKRQFFGIGHFPGRFQVSATTERFRPSPGPILASNILGIEVFPFLEIIPTNLLLTPNMRYTLRIQGGPQKETTDFQVFSQNEIKFDIQDSEIASIDQHRDVTAHKVGDTTLFYKVVQIGSASNSVIISQRTVKIRVRLVTDIEIPYNHNRQIFQGSIIKLNGVLKFGEEYFNHGVAPISYNWNSTAQNVLLVQIPNRSDLPSGSSTGVLHQTKKIRDATRGGIYTFHTALNSSSVYSQANGVGESEVQLDLAIEYPVTYYYEKNWFSTRITVRTTQELTVNVPQYINTHKQTHQYLLPPHAYNKLQMNREAHLKLGYSMQSVYDYASGDYQYKESATPIIALENDEGIRTFDKVGKVTVIIEENQAFSDQVVMLNV